MSDLLPESEPIPEILIADDSKSNQLSITAALSGLDIDVILASTGLEALRKAAARKPAVIILDVDLPDMDGYQVINQLSGSGTTNNIPVILMETNFASRKAGLHGSSIWPTEIVYKPLNYVKLERMVSQMLLLNKHRNAVTTIREFEDEMGDGGEEGVIAIDAHGTICYCNPRMVKMLRTHYSELLGIGLESLFEKDCHETDPKWHEHTVAAALAAEKTVQVKKAVLWTHDGGKVTTTFVAVPVAGHPTLQGLLVFKDISRKSKADEQITSLSTHDFLTGLSNRFKFEEVLSGLIKLYQAKTNVLISRKRSAPCAVLYLGLDHFSHINKGLGHDTGDKLLQGVAHRIKACISELDIAARLGGDEFTVALTHMFDASDAKEVGLKILKSLDEPFLIEGNEIYTSASIGIATYPECGDTSAELLTNASTAMQSAKANGRHTIQFYTDALNENYLDLADTEAKLREALTNDQIELHYQPIFNSQSESTTGYQLGLTWKDSDGEIRDIARFIDGLDNVQLQTLLAYRLLKESCSQFAAWQHLGDDRDESWLVIPFPAFHLVNSSFISNVRTAIRDSGILPQCLVLEINETRVDFNLREVKTVFNELAELGVRVSLNLFSSPKTPITHLFQLNLDVLRIDIRSMDSLLDHPKSSIFLKSILSMAHDLGIQVVIDGIESEREQALVRGLGADAYMGAYPGLPGPLGIASSVATTHQQTGIQRPE